MYKPPFVSQNNPVYVKHVLSPRNCRVMDDWDWISGHPGIDSDDRMDFCNVIADSIVFDTTGCIDSQLT